MHAGTTTEAGPLPLREARARFEREYILYRLSANHGNLGRTARDLGIERTNLYRKMKQLGISAPVKTRDIQLEDD
jgi:DNA-binding NtrC family response regulator